MITRPIPRALSVLFVCVPSMDGVQTLHWDSGGRRVSSTYFSLIQQNLCLARIAVCIYMYVCVLSPPRLLYEQQKEKKDEVSPHPVELSPEPPIAPPQSLPLVPKMLVVIGRAYLCHGEILAAGGGLVSSLCTISGACRHRF